ncbi:hypothetical protein CYLTODRAFT_456172 [Cylindrobasidium torrendii FP15055 ss-10]|uniref:Uncharacterized protein n=1 Tax=Cylindrobasidium torrendii FP15055 ss-10 TaxID=1314674 RepID=A0A0D7B510_9AGAR|nr:hypothetical protein CYLTODRAFT_456172 [Cylindrobasidium torrendii FP15055 ss-10]
MSKMHLSLPLDCFSLSSDFSCPPVDLPYVDPYDKTDTLLDRLEYFHGMCRGDSEAFLNSPSNTIKCRKDFAALLASSIQNARLFLFPRTIKTTIQKMRELVLSNSESSINGRTTFEKNFPHMTYEYRFIFLNFKEAIYVRHPTTGQITRHNAPYRYLPMIKSTLNPCFWATRTANICAVSKSMLFQGNNSVWHVYSLGHAYDKRIPLDFFYHGGRALGDFPHRRIPYTPQELGVPELPTARKRARSETDSDDWTAVSVADANCDLPGITAWRESATDTHSSGSRTLVDVEMAPPCGDKEPAGVLAQDGGCGDQWLLVLKQRAAEASDKLVRKTYDKLIRDVARARSRPIPPAKPCKTKITPRPAAVRPLKIRRLY